VIGLRTSFDWSKINFKNLRVEYEQGRITVPKIAKRLGISTTSVLRKFKAEGIKTRGRTKLVDFRKQRRLAYILGVIHGDGWATFCERTKRYEIGLASKDKNFAEKFASALQDLGLKVYFGYQKKRELWRVSANGKELKLWVDRNPLPNFKEQELMVAYIEGFYESEGSTKNIVFTNTNKERLLRIKVMLSKLGIESRLQGPYFNSGGTEYYFLYVLKQSQRKFKELIKPVNKYNSGGG